MPQGRVFTPNPVNPDWSDNAGSVALFLGLPELSRGPNYFDLHDRFRGTLVNSPAWGVDRNGYGTLTFNISGGADTEVTAPGRVSSATDNWTMVCAFKAGVQANQQCVVFNGNDSGGWGIFSRGDVAGQGVAGLLGGVAWLDSGYTAAEGEDVHAVFTRRAGTAYFFVNGRPAGTPITNTPITPTDNFAVGRQPGSTMRWFGGTAYYTQVLDAGWGDAQAYSSYDQWLRGFPDALRRPRGSWFVLSQVTTTVPSAADMQGGMTPMTGGILA